MTKKQIMQTIFNNSEFKAHNNKRFYNTRKKNIFVEALRLYKDVSHKQAKEHLLNNGQTRTQSDKRYMYQQFVGTLDIQVKEI